MLTLAAACSDDAGRYPGAIDDPATFLTRIGQAECDYLVRCHLVENADACVSYVRDILHTPRYDPRLLTAIERGTVDYSPDAAGRCVDGLDARTCTVFEPWGPPKECNEVFEGRVEAGEPVSWNFECKWYAVPGPESGCGEDRCCPLHCEAGMSYPPSEAPGLGDSCVAQSGLAQCKKGLLCDGHVCVPGPAPGGFCALDIVCPEGHACANGRCTAFDAIGDMCMERTMDRTERCVDVAAVCGSDGLCRRVGFAGAACDDVQTFCGLELQCDPATHRCVGLAGAGEACIHQYACAQGLLCDPTTRLCKPLLADNELCSYYGECASGYCRFRDNRCADPETCP